MTWALFMRACAACRNVQRRPYLTTYSTGGHARTMQWVSCGRHSMPAMNAACRVPANAACLTGEAKVKMGAGCTRPELKHTFPSGARTPRVHMGPESLRARRTPGSGTHAPSTAASRTTPHRTRVAVRTTVQSPLHIDDGRLPTWPAHQPVGLRPED